MTTLVIFITYNIFAKQINPASVKIIYVYLSMCSPDDTLLWRSHLKTLFTLFTLNMVLSIATKMASIENDVTILWHHP